jgi:hypothetical protein
MIKKTIFIIFLSLACLAQEKNQNDPSIELPEFVITGVERITLPILPKPRAEFISVLSNDFIKPHYSPEELLVSDISSPARKDAIARDSVIFLNGKIQVGAGVQTLPIAEYSFGSTFTNGLVVGKIFGKSERQYVKYAGVNGFGGDLAALFFINDSSGFLPGARIKIGGNYNLESYNFYRPDTLKFKRDIQQGNLNLTISNLMNENFKFDVKLNDCVFYLKDRKLNENLLSLNGFFETGLKEFSIATVFKLQSQNIKYDTLQQNDNGFIHLNPFALINISDVVKLRGGITYDHSGNNNFFAVYGFAAIKFNDNVSFYGELSPKAEFISISDLCNKNRYFNPRAEQYVFQKEKMNIKGAVKYEYKEYFELDAGMGFTDYSNYVYFIEEGQASTFTIKTTNAKRLSGFFNFLFHTGPNGLFYGNLVLENVKDYLDYFIPYSPSLRSTLAYGYQFNSGLRIDPKLYFAAFSYAGEGNTKKINEFIDLGFRAEYEFSENLRGFTEFSNLLNHHNYYWTGYQEKPFDAIIGIDYRW